MLSERKQHILVAVIETYVRTGEPVGSKAVVDRLENAVSPATIRNEMADLVALGYLEQPHTSAGRVPTSKAFRLYIDSLMPHNTITDERRRDLDEQLQSGSQDPEQIIASAAQALSDMTGCVVVTTTPSEQSVAVTDIELKAVSAHTVAVLLTIGTGSLRTRVCRMPTPIELDFLHTLELQLRERFVGKPIGMIGVGEIQSLLAVSGERAWDYAPVLTTFYELVCAAAESDLMLNGQLNLLKHPDYHLEDARSLLFFLSQQDQLRRLMTAHSGGLRVILGEENPRPELNSSSILMTRYVLHNGANGSIGLIGPLRMDYAQMIPQLEYVAGAVGKWLTDLTKE